MIKCSHAMMSARGLLIMAIETIVVGGGCIGSADAGVSPSADPQCAPEPKACFLDGILEEAHEKNLGVQVKAVVSTSDSWPHIGGLRQAVARGLPVYILDLNTPLLDRLIAAPHHLHPDLLAESPRQPDWRKVSGEVQLGTGSNRMELYPLRGASTERQYMVYFPEHHLLYASDTLALNGDGSLYDPELMREVIEAARRNNLQVATVFAMHEGPVSWERVVSLVEKATIS
jgi:hypothetical protein